MSRETFTSFTEKFFEVEHCIRYFTLGMEPSHIFENLITLDLDNGENSRLFKAANLAVRSSNWRIGIFSDFIILCGQLYSKGTLAIFQDQLPGSCFAIFTDSGKDAIDCLDEMPEE